MAFGDMNISGKRNSALIEEMENLIHKRETVNAYFAAIEREDFSCSIPKPECSPSEYSVISKQIKELKMKMGGVL